MLPLSALEFDRCSFDVLRSAFVADILSALGTSVVDEPKGAANSSGTGGATAAVFSLEYMAKRSLFDFALFTKPRLEDDVDEEEVFAMDEVVVFEVFEVLSIERDCGGSRGIFGIRGFGGDCKDWEGIEV